MRGRAGFHGVQSHVWAAHGTQYTTRPGHTCSVSIITPSFLVKKAQGPDCCWRDHPTDDSPGNSRRPSHSDTSKFLCAFSELVLLSMKTERSNQDLQAETFVSGKRFHLPFYFQAVFNEGT